METKERAIHSIEESMKDGGRSPHDAAGVAHHLFELARRFGMDDVDVSELIRRFLARLPEWGFEDLLQRRAEYAIRLAEAGGALEYEEMHKLLSLCDSVYELESLGSSFDPALRRDFEHAVEARLRRERNMAYATAQERVKEWATGRWWYVEALHGGSKREGH